MDRPSAPPYLSLDNPPGTSPPPTTAPDDATGFAVCLVCGDRSNSIRKHYGAHSCEACKCFFRRSVQMEKQYSCRYTRQCPIGTDKRVRHWCQYCRFQKCIEVGMKKEAVKLHRSTFYPPANQQTQNGQSTAADLAIEQQVSNIRQVAEALAMQLPKETARALLRKSPSPSMNNGGVIGSDGLMNSQPAVTTLCRTNPPSPMEQESTTAKIKMERFNDSSIGDYMPYSQMHILHTMQQAPPDLIPGSQITSNSHVGNEFLSNKRAGSLPDLASTSLPGVERPQTTPPVDDNEASVEEVLETLKHRILCLFQWSKQHVVGFADLSANDQKALLRNSVVEIVMLGFAKRSTVFKGALQLITGKMMSPGHGNPGVSTVARLLLDKVVKPLRMLNLNDYEHMILKQIILFNPVASGVKDVEAVRQMRRTRLVELQEYTSNAEQGRFGEMLCMLPPLYEVSQEVVEQLRLEQFVSDGEMRFDAVLLMSIVNGEVNLTTVDPTADPNKVMTPPASKPPPLAPISPLVGEF